MTVDGTIEFIAALLMLSGAVMALLSAIGIMRFPDVYTRSHAGTKSSTLAVLLTLLGAFIHFASDQGFYSVRLLLGIVFVFLTAPVAGHVIIRAAYRANVKMSDTTIEDELKGVLQQVKQDAEADRTETGEIMSEDKKEELKHQEE
ncbi:Na+/H+ antiporter subunit G [Gracilibacillus alcaliphilus]|uniref:Na+/H+ antiporter subunit G n=1 Tax=Gracilibacillus alcaliphilus TaxID=1401441 RepID=UPI0019587E50|nr:multicomponent Na+:H+ antiporter subunit G [Gracilibacillus alcaliphilus]